MSKPIHRSESVAPTSAARSSRHTMRIPKRSLRLAALVIAAAFALMADSKFVARQFSKDQAREL